MNTSKLQAFATDARRQLMNAVQARLDAALVPNSDAQVDDPRAFDFLQHEIERAGGGEEGRRHVVERYAYRWFNRIIAFRYMDVHGFTGTPVVSPAGLTSMNGLPEVLAAAKRGEYDDSTVFSLRGNDKAKERIEGLLSGSIMADDPQGLAYGLLLQSECRFWNRNLPFMFESVVHESGRVDELLMPADLLAEGSVLRNAVEAMTPEDCGVDDPSGNVEIIGWLYQYYISERKNEVMDGFKKNHKAGADEIPAATQLFTPDWIVRYLVQNTVGRLWVQSHPDSQLYKNWDYYIQPSEDGSTENEDILNIQTPEELTVCDPACGSGHMLTYAFDLLYEIYEEEGYAPSDIPGLILKHNLYGMEIDERAVSLAAFALTMKARSRSRRFFKKQVEPNIQRIAPISFEEGEVAELNDLYQVNLDSMVWNTYAKADVYGSLIQPPRELVDLASSAEDTEDEITLADSLLRECADEVFAQTRYLARKYMAVVANPPYMGAKNMSAELKQFVQDHYEDVKADLYGCFYVRFLKFAMEYGLEGMVLGDTWMFIKTFEEMRKDLIKKRRIESFLHIRDITNHPDIFGANAAFIICPCYVSHKKTTFIKLTQTGVVRKCFELLSILAADKSKARFEVNQHEFVQIPGSPIVYWLSEAVFKIFDRKIAKGAGGDALSDIADVAQGVTTGDNARFLRFWWECYCRTIQFDRISLQETPLQRWVPCDKGGGFRRWSGNNEYIVDWTENGEKLFDFPGSTPRNREITFKNALACSKISSGQPSFRRRNHGFAYSDAAVALSDSTLLSELNCFLNSTTALTIMQALSPTLNFEVGQIRSLPCKFGISANWRDREKELVSASEKDWDSFETSWDFQRFALLDPDQGAQAGNLLEDAVLHLREYWHRVSEEQRQRERSVITRWLRTRMACVMMCHVTCRWNACR